MRLSQNDNAELVAELRCLWKKRKPFLMQMEVGSPYDGCFYEPNLFLVTPPGSSMQKELQDAAAVRWGPARERTWKALSDWRMKVSYARVRFDMAWDYARGDKWGPADPAELAKLPELFDELQVCELAEIEAAVDFELASAADPEPMKQPQLYVWPLYASGQGAAMDCVHNIRELVQVFEDESCYDLANRPVWPEGLFGSRFATGSDSYGRITPVAVVPMGPINSVLPAGERYWMHALHVAAEQWGVSLSWKCSGCDSEIEYDEHEGRPEATSYSGDGGIGVHLHGVLCDQCLQEGACDHCRDQGCDPMEYYDLDVKEHGWNLCEWCTKELLEGSGLVGEVDLPATVELRWWKPPGQLELPGVHVPPRLVFCVDDVPIEGLTYDVDCLMGNAKDMRLEHLEYGHGLALSGTTVENCAYKGVE